jgi:hypothetical protein
VKLCKSTKAAHSHATLLLLLLLLHVQLLMVLPGCHCVAAQLVRRHICMCKQLLQLLRIGQLRRLGAWLHI